MVEYTGGAGVERVAFFFAQPPPVDDEGARMRRRRHRSESAGVMWQQTGRTVDTVKAWRRAIRDAAREARS